jgi:hypothetical protein
MNSANKIHYGSIMHCKRLIPRSPILAIIPVGNFDRLYWELRSPILAIRLPDENEHITYLADSLDDPNEQSGNTKSIV